MDTSGWSKVNHGILCGRFVNPFALVSFSPYFRFLLYCLFFCGLFPHMNAETTRALRGRMKFKFCLSDILLTLILFVDAELLDEVNSLLVAVGISSKRISSLDELTRVASSMFVAIFESLFQVRLEGIIRNPYTTMDYVINAQLVVDGLSHQIQMDLQHISGESIVNGDVRALSNLIHILYRCVNMTT